MKNPDCIFCKIVEGKIPSTKIFENSKVLAFQDLQPSAAVHYLVIHKNHSKDVNDLVAAESSQLIDIFSAIKEITEKEKLDQKGFRVLTNMGPHAGQTVFHTHFHLLGGEPLRGFGSR
jgi:histidine triad (HIT) family protein